MMDIMNVVRDFEDYFQNLTLESEKPTDDVASVIANALIDGEHLPALETNGYYMIIAMRVMIRLAHRRPGGY